MGNPTAVTGATASAYTATYNLAGRLATLTKAGATTTYAYDNSGRRIRKFISSGTGAGAASTVIFAYDLNDQLIGEYTSTGAAIREYAWLGNIPIAIFTPDPAAATNPPLVYYIQTDHLNTPRVVFNKANQIRWRWLAEPFGTTAPETNPSGLGVFTQPLRFPGQYADSESGLFYNHWRTYDPATGRFTQPDPIGLAAGDMGLYNYVGSNPLMYIDPNGLWAIGDPLPQGVVDFSAGMGDVILFGQGQRLRDLADVDGGIDKCSTAYSAGEWAGVGVGVAIGVAGGIRAAGARGAGKEFSHWIPNRMGGPRSIANGNYVSRETHALSDPFRYRFMPRDWKAANPMPNQASQQWVRLPNVYKGAGAGAAYGAGGTAMNDCTCPQ
jgi:RHS repeat-associated protein